MKYTPPASANVDDAIYSARLLLLWDMTFPNVYLFDSFLHVYMDFKWCWKRSWECIVKASLLTLVNTVIVCEEPF